MDKKSRISYLLLISALVVSLGLFISPVLAHEEDATTTPQDRQQQDRQETNEQRCQRHQAAVDGRAAKIMEAHDKSLGHLNTVFEQIQNFVTKRGLDVADYEQLKSNVANAQSAATAAVEAIEATVPKLNCDSEDHKAEIHGMKDSVTSAVKALKAYRQSLHELIKAVKQPAKEQAQNEVTP
ncbi:hypothetical protein HY441_00240 [Candidatus Microgenomates bacterium]|nr:hypothetical protein [Candidatus Microgenomates bacterium]